MDFRFSEEQEAFRQEFVSWLEKTLKELRGDATIQTFESHKEWEAAARDFQKRLYQAGYSARHYPKEYGGQGRPIEEHIIVSETISRICGEYFSPWGVTMGMAAPTIMTCGNEEQKKTFIPKILDGTHIWCQGFSEPNAGSDVVNVSTRAVKQGDYYVVSGQKVWTSMAHMADYCILLVRTDPEAPKHKGLSYLLLDMKAPGVEVRPIKQMTGEAEFNEIFMEDVKVPATMLVGQEGQGWMIAITTLMFERAMGDANMASRMMRAVEEMFDNARKTRRSAVPLIKDPRVRQQLAQAYIEILVLKCHGYRHLSQLLGGGVPGPEGSIGKLLWSESGQRINEWNMELQGPFSQIMHGSPWTIQEGRGQYGFLRSKGFTIEAGTSEIQRNIIGERVLGLPKDASRVKRN
ncbi:MAG: acyl-CoA dehydrogenase family protein [Proteobacteria bacterium]|nr:acyl-CoA dehydrogenase family protein [Pseudomonadota bacterium]